MSFDIQSNRNRWTAGLLILVIIITLMIALTIRFLQIRAEGSGPRVGQRSPIAELAYCGSQEDGLCVVSFNQIVDGAMEVNIQVPHAFYPEIRLIIDRFGQKNAYECERDEELDTRVACRGAPQVPGEILQFIVISKNRGTWLAEGKFAIIGIAISTPEIAPTATIVTPTETPTVTPTGVPTPRRTPTPSGTRTSPSYPNPSYP